MTDLFIQWGNFLFHTRNVLFPVLVAIMLYLWPPVAIDDVTGVYYMTIGLALIIIGQGLRILTIGLSYIVRGGRMRRIYAENLVTDGLFSHCRNPLYVGNVMIVMGFVFIAGNLTGIIVGSLAFMAIYRLIVYSEESFLSTKFGEAYSDFCNDVPRWIPRFNGLMETIKNYEFDWPKVAVKEYGTIMTSLIIPLGLIAYKINLANRLSEYQSILISLAVLIMGAYGFVRFLKKTGRLKPMR
ncbi:MAG: methyltransferase family protein [Methylococcaceae bacterium]